MKTEHGQLAHGTPAHDHNTIAHAPGDGQRRGNATAHPPDTERHEPGVMMAEHHAMARWVQPVLMILGAWLIASPATLGYRNAALTWSDILSGALVIGLAALALAPHRAWAGWATSVVGAWLLFAPLIFWAPDAVRFLNIPLGAWIVAAPWLLSGATAGAKVNAVIVGGLLILFNVLRGKVRKRYGNWDRFVV